MSWILRSPRTDAWNATAHVINAQNSLANSVSQILPDEPLADATSTRLVWATGYSQVPNAANDSWATYRAGQLVAGPYTSGPALTFDYTSSSAYILNVFLHNANG